MEPEPGGVEYVIISIYGALSGELMATVQAELKSKVQEIREEAERQSGRRPLSLLFGSVALQDVQTLADYRLHDGAQIQAMHDRQRQVYGWLAASLQLAAKRRFGAGRQFASRYRKLFFQLWDKHAGATSMHIAPQAALDFAEEMVHNGWRDWRLNEKDIELLHRFDGTTGMPMVAFLLWGEDEQFDIDQWECLALGKPRPSMAIPTRQSVLGLLDDALSVIGHVEYSVERHELNPSYIAAYSELWEKHAGSQSLFITSSCVEALVADLSNAGFDSPLGPDQEIMFNHVGGNLTISLLACVAWTESMDFRPHDWLL